MMIPLSADTLVGFREWMVRRGYDPATFVVGYAVEPDIPSETSKVQLTHKAFELMMEFLAEQSKLN